MKRASLMMVSVLMLLLLAACDRDDDPVVVSDVEGPVAVQDLALVAAENDAVTLSWTAPADAGNGLPAASYDLRYAGSEAELLEAWSEAVAVDDPPVPSAPGTRETHVVGGLVPGASYWFGLSALDAAGNRSVISNVVHADAACAMVVNGPGDGSTFCEGDNILVAWTAPACTGDAVRITLLLDGDSAAQLATETENDGQFAWACAGVGNAVDGYAIRVTDLTSGDSVDSPGSFSIGRDCSTISVNAEGTGDYPTIQEAIDAAPNGAVIELDDGVYTGAGNSYLQLRGKTLTVRSASGDPAACILDSDSHGALFWFQAGDGDETVIEGITMTRGNGVLTIFNYRGGGLVIEESSPTIRNCIITKCWTPSGSFDIRGGAGVFCNLSSAVFERCLIVDNYAVPRYGEQARGGGMLIYGMGHNGPVSLDRCTIARNDSESAGGIATGSNTSIVIRNTIIAENLGPAIVGGVVIIECTNIYGNTGGDWTGDRENWLGTEGNISVDPQFCDPDAGDFALSADSPCRSENTACGTMGWSSDDCSGARSEVPLHRVEFRKVKR